MKLKKSSRKWIKKY